MIFLENKSRSKQNKYTTFINSSWGISERKMREINFSSMCHIFSAECTIGMVWGFTSLKYYGDKALWHCGHRVWTLMFVWLIDFNWFIGLAARGVGICEHCVKCVVYVPTLLPWALQKAIYTFQKAPCSPCGTFLFRTKAIFVLNAWADWWALVSTTYRMEDAFHTESHTDVEPFSMW